MSKTYFIAPLVALILFIGAYSWSQSGRAEREQARAAEVRAEREAKLLAEREAREKAIAEALVFQEQRRKERAERETREAAERETRQNALDARDHAYRRQERLARDIERLRREVADEQEAVNRLRIDKDASLAEQAHLKAFLPRIRAAAAELEKVLRQIAAAETERARQAAAAAAAKK